MLTMTDTAAEAVKTIIARVPEAGDGGVRIRDTGAQNGFELSVAPAPEPQDTVVVTDEQHLLRARHREGPMMPCSRRAAISSAVTPISVSTASVC